MNSFAGRPLPVNEDVYRSESKTNTHNHAIVLLLKSYGRFYDDPSETLDLYTRQCSVAGGNYYSIIQQGGKANENKESI